MKRLFLSIILIGIMSYQSKADNIKVDTIAEGVIKLTIGTPDKYNPYFFCPESPKYKEIEELPDGSLPFLIEHVEMSQSSRGCQIGVPMGNDENLYGFGLQIGSFQQNGLKKKPIVNDNPLNNLGYTHAPQPFYVSTKGYGILVNTLRYTTFHCGTNKKKSVESKNVESDGKVSTSTDDLYKNVREGNYVYIDVPNCDGVELFIFEGKGLMDVVQRYNLFSGGGCLPPLWGLGFKYRTKTDFTQDGVMRIQSYFRRKSIPCDVIGLEPGWHTAAYSCSYVWNKERYPNHKEMLDALKKNNFKLNLWEHAYVHPSSPLWEPLKDKSGDFLVWNGLVPDFVTENTRDIFANYHKQLVEEGVSGFKLDECDNSNIGSGNATWGFPDMTQFPSGIDGEQMHQAFGVLYLRTMNEIFKKQNKRTFQDYRASGLFVSSIPASLYSDIYGHKDYIQMISNSAFGGLVWSPEVRQSSTKTDFFHRLQTVLLSGHAVVDSWFLQNPPWLQYDRDKNNNSEFLPDSIEMENITRKLINVRMQLVPYLYSAFAEYNQKGIPPFRPLVMDFQSDKNVLSIDNQYMIGECLMAAPLVGEDMKREVYFPEGVWYDFNNDERYEGGKSYEISFELDEMPLFVKSGSILPLANVNQYLDVNTSFDIVCKVYGKDYKTCHLYEDDGETYNYNNKEYNWLTLSIKNKKVKSEVSGKYKKSRYKIKGCLFVE